MVHPVYTCRFSLNITPQEELGELKLTPLTLRADANKQATSMTTPIENKASNFKRQTLHFSATVVVLISVLVN